MTVSVQIENDDRDYDQFLQRLGARFDRLMSVARPLFTTDAADLMTVYLDALPQEHRQYHTCNSCRRFLENWGGLVVIGEDGRTDSAVWDASEFDGYYQPGIAALEKAVRKAKVTGVFLSSDRTWGTASNPKGQKHGGIGEWKHLNLRPPPSLLHRDFTKTPGQAMAEKRDDRGNVLRALAEFGVDKLKTAVKVLSADALDRSEKVLGAAQWLLSLAENREAAKGKYARENLTWLAVAKAPAGFCHPRSSMIGTLLDDIAAGMDFDTISDRWRKKMHPLRYQRPQAAPSAGTIKQAEELVAKLGIAPSLRRRFARLDEIVALWKPTEVKPQAAAGGVFSHLLPKGEAKRTPFELPAEKITWEKFAAKVLPTAQRMECYAPAHGGYTALVTASDPAAPPILQWDTEAQRNPFSLYVWNGGSAATQWGLRAGWVKVNAITRSPHTWHGGSYSHFPQAAIFILDGARESSFKSLALFPEILKSELHGVRSVIEAHSRSGRIEGAEEGSACGLLFPPQARVRIADGDGDWRVFDIDRWD